MTPDDGVSVFESVRPRLFGIAYRMLGSAAEAEDIVQDAWLRWQGTDRTVVVDPSIASGFWVTPRCSDRPWRPDSFSSLNFLNLSSGVC